MVKVRAAATPLALAFWALVSACAPRVTVAPTPEPEPPVVVTPKPKPPPARWSVTLAEIGWDVVPSEPPDRAFKANTDGWRAHERGDWADSRPSFAEAVQIESEYDLARYNLACADSRLGHLDAALDELTTVLERDFPRFKRVALEDPDLGNLRRSGLNDELEWRLDRLEEVWAKAMTVGTPTIAWRPWTDSSIGKAQGGQGQLLRPGVWVDRTHRFVPAMELREGVFSAMVDVERQQAIIVTGARTADTPPLFRDAQLFVAPLSPVGETARSADLVLDNLTSIEVSAVSSGVRVRLNHTKGAWRELRAGGLIRVEQDLPNRPTMLVTPDGSMLVAALPGGWSYKNHSVFPPGGGEIVLQSTQSVTTHRSILINAAGTWAVIVGARMKCGTDGPVLRHAIDRIDLSAGTAEALSNKDGAAAAYWGRDGALYLQIGDRTIRYAAPDDDSFETLPEGVLLAPPMALPTCKAK